MNCNHADILEERRGDFAVLRCRKCGMPRIVSFQAYKAERNDALARTHWGRKAIREVEAMDPKERVRQSEDILKALKAIREELDYHEDQGTNEDV